jgi:hypothetical protein
LGLGALVVDHTRAGCQGCDGFPPALETSAAAGARLTEWLAVGVQAQAHVEFVSGDMRDDSRFGAIAGFVYGQLTLPSIFQVLAGFGYGGADYQYTVPGLFTSVDRTASVGSGPATLLAGRIRLGHLRWAELALEARWTTISLGAAGTEHGLTFSFAGGLF